MCELNSSGVSSLKRSLLRRDTASSPCVPLPRTGSFEEREGCHTASHNAHFACRPANFPLPALSFHLRAVPPKTIYENTFIFCSFYPLPQHIFKYIYIHFKPLTKFTPLRTLYTVCLYRGFKFSNLPFLPLKCSS